jgi:GMP synthase-like glutamine amidotransferase
MKKKIAIIDNYEGGIPPHRFKGFMAAFKPMNEKIDLEFIGFRDLHRSEVFHSALAMDGLILSGSPFYMSKNSVQEKMVDEIKLVDQYSKPILAICFGHQLIGHSFGFKVDYLDQQYLGTQNHIILNLKLNSPYEIIVGNSISVELNHNQEVKYSPEFEKLFQLYASSEACKLQIVKHKTRPIYSVQFHPETLLDEKAQREGAKFLQNFVSIL